MSAVKIKLSQFQGSGKLFTRDADGLASILRGFAIDNARLKVEVSGVHDFTDNSTGVSQGSSIPLVVVPTVAVDATAGGGATAAALNTSLGKIQNAGKVIASTIQEAASLLGLTGPSSAAGTIAAADTIPALDKTNAAGSGNAAADFYSGVAALKVASDNLHRLINAENEVLVALGVAPLARSAVPHPLDETLLAIPVVTASSAGPNALAQADAQAFLAAYANAVATIAAAWNGAMNQGTPGAGALHVVAG